MIDKYNATHPASDAAVQRKCADGLRAPEGSRNRRVQLIYDAYLLMPAAPTMLQARDAYLAADMIRFGGANRTNSGWRSRAAASVRAPFNQRSLKQRYRSEA